VPATDTLKPQVLDLHSLFNQVVVKIVLNLTVYVAINFIYSLFGKTQQTTGNCF